MAFGEMFKKRLGDAAMLVEKQFEKRAPPPEEPEEEAPEAEEEEGVEAAAAGADEEEAAEEEAADEEEGAGEEEESDEDADSDDEEDSDGSDDEEDSDEEKSEDEPPRKSKSGKDYVTDEGMEFNDDEDEQGQYVDMGNGKTGFKPDWADWDKGDLEAFWVKSFALDEAKGQGRAAYAAKLKELGLRNENHWYRVRETFTLHYQREPAWQQAMIDARMSGMKQMMSAAANAKGGLFDPVEGVTLEQYATVQARRAKLTGADEFPKLLAEYGMDEAKWAQVDKVFMGRMSDPSDPMATAAFATEYGKFFSAASSGQFAAGAKAGAGAMGLDSSHKNVKGAAEPVFFERYVEIMTAQECWATSGKDVNAMLKKVFNMDAMDWSNLGAYWSQKMMADINMAMKLPELQEKYRPRYQQAGQDDDLEV
mgnify:CR=1 FL=1